MRQLFTSCWLHFIVIRYVFIETFLASYCFCNMSKKRVRSIAWDFFRKNVEQPGLVTVKCILCQIPTVLKFKGNTTNLLKHLENHHGETYAREVKIHIQPKKSGDQQTSSGQHGVLDVEEDTMDSLLQTPDNNGFINDANNTTNEEPLLERSTSVSSQSSTRTISNQSSSDVVDKQLEPYPLNGAHMREFKNALILFIVRGMHPLSLVDDCSFVDFVKFFDPRLTTPCRNTITHTLLPDLYQQARKKLLEDLLLAEYVALTTDCWSSRCNDSYITVTVHYISRKFRMISRVLVTQQLDESHTSAYLREIILKIIDDWQLKGKVVAVVTDNAANIVKAIGPEGCNLTHIPCFAHTLSLVVKGAIEATSELTMIIASCRNIVTFVHASHVATARLNRLRTDSSLKRLQQDVATRWNSTLIMLRSLLEMKDDIMDVLKIVDRRDLEIQEYEWETVAGMVEILTPFEEVTTELSSQFYPSLSKLLPVIKLVMARLSSFVTTEYNPWLLNLLNALKRGMAERFSLTDKNAPSLISSYLDPRFKTNYMSDSYGRGGQLAEQLIVEELRDNRMRRQQEVSPTLPATSELPQAASPIPRRLSIVSKAHNDIVAAKNLAKAGGTNRVANNIVLLEEYLDLPLQEWAEDPLKWWKRKKLDGTLVPLTELVRKFFCIPATSVPSEQLFSCAGNLVTEKRSRLCKENVDMLLFLYKNV